MNEKLKNLKDKITTLFKNGIIYGIILCSIAASFFVGSFYNQMTNKNKSSKVQVRTIVKSEVNLAIDENNHLIVIDKKTGNYSIYRLLVPQVKVIGNNVLIMTLKWRLMTILKN